jgi:hypothetical protein
MGNVSLPEELQRRLDERIEGRASRVGAREAWHKREPAGERTG